MNWTSPFICICLHDYQRNFPGDRTDRDAPARTPGDRLGIVGQTCLAVHAVHLDAAEITTLRGKGKPRRYRPSSNMKLASGIAPVRGLLAAGIPVAWAPMAQPPTIVSIYSRRCATPRCWPRSPARMPAAVPAHQALWMATMGGAHAQSAWKARSARSRRASRRTVAISLASLETQPCFDPVSQLVYAAGVST